MGCVHIEILVVYCFYGCVCMQLTSLDTTTSLECFYKDSFYSFIEAFKNILALMFQKSIQV